MTRQEAVLQSILSIAGAGDHIVSSSALIENDTLAQALPKHGVGVTFVDPAAAHIASAIRQTTKAIYTEAGLDLRAIAALARGHGIPLIVNAA